jgi:CRP-like cAMP-binding protein
VQDVKSVFSGLAIPSTEMSPETATTAVADHSNLESPLSSRGRVSLLSIKRLSSVAGGIIPSDLLNLLHTLPFFTGLEKSEEFICKISKVLSLRKFYPGDVVVTQGETAKAMFFIIKGSLTVISDDGEIELAELTSGTYCMFSSLLQSGNMSLFNLYSW